MLVAAAAVAAESDTHIAEAALLQLYLHCGGIFLPAVAVQEKGVDDFVKQWPSRCLVCLCAALSVVTS